MAPYPCLPSLAGVKQRLLDEFPGLAAPEGLFAAYDTFVVVVLCSFSVVFGTLWSGVVFKGYGH